MCRALLFSLWGGDKESDLRVGLPCGRFVGVASPPPHSSSTVVVGRDGVEGDLFSLRFSEGIAESRVFTGVEGVSVSSRLLVTKEHFLSGVNVLELYTIVCAHVLYWLGMAL